MKKTILMILAAMVVLSGSAGAMDYFYSTTGLNSITHDRAYTWGMNTQWSPGETISGATLTFYGLYDWTQEVDMLFITLLDNPSLGVHSVYDGQNPIADYFAGMGTSIGTWSDPNGGSAHKQNISFTFDASQLSALMTDAADGRFGFGVDGDCHYYASRTEFMVTTSPIPEPATMILLGLGLTGLGLVRRRK